MKKKTENKKIKKMEKVKPIKKKKEKIKPAVPKKNLKPKKAIKLPVEEKENDNEVSTKKVKIKVIGIGGGGSNIVFELSKRLKDFSAQKIEFVAANTDSQALRSISKSLKIFSFGNKITDGLGCGSDISVGEKAAREDLERIKHLFSDKKDLYIIVSSFGGGTGTGSAPVFIKTANDLKLPVLSIFTLPFAFEGKKKIDHSLAAIEKSKEFMNAYMTLPNEKIFSLSKEEVSFSEALNLLNDRLAGSLEGLFRTIYNPGLINVDWADIRTVLEGNKKIAYLDVVKIKSSQNLEEFAKNILNNPIFDYNFENADNIMFNIESSKNLSLQLLSQISERISVHVPNARIIFGLTQNPKLKNEIKITIFSTSSENNSLGKKDWNPKNIKNRLKPIIKDGILNLEKQETMKEIPESEDKSGKKEKVEKKEDAISKASKKEKSKPKPKKKKSKNKEESKLEIKEEKVDNKEQALPLSETEESPVRRNALQVKEQERLEREQEDNKEKIFDIPAFLRKDKNKK